MSKKTVYILLGITALFVGFKIYESKTNKTKTPEYYAEIIKKFGKVSSSITDLVNKLELAFLKAWAQALTAKNEVFEYNNIQYRSDTGRALR